MAISLMSGYNNISASYRIPEASAVTPQKNFVGSAVSVNPEDGMVFRK